MNDQEDRRIEELGRRVREREEQDYAELLRPLDKAERSALADDIFAAIDKKAAAEPSVNVAAPEAPAPVVSMADARARKGRFRASSLVALLAAAFGAMALFAVLRKEPPAPISYSLAIEGGNQTKRGDEPSPDTVLRLDPASRLALALRPKTPISGAIAVRGFLVRDGAAQPWEPPVLLGAGGVVRIEGTAAALFSDVPEGEWNVVLVLGRPEALPDDGELRRAAESGNGLAGLSIHRVRILLSKPHGALGPQRKPQIGFSGCTGLRVGQQCELGSDRTLTFFVPGGPSTAVDLRVDGSSVETGKEVIAGGIRIAVKIPDGARTLQMNPAATSDLAPLNLSLAAADVLPDALGQAETARRRGDLEGATKLLEPILSQGSPAAQLQALRQKARIALATRGRFDEAAQLLRQAITQDRSAGRISDELEDTFALAYGLLLEKRAFGEVRGLLNGLEPLVAAYPAAAPKVAYYQGLLALETGDLRAALAFFSTAATGAQRLGLDAYGSAVLEQEAEVLAVLGRHDEAALRHALAQSAAGSSADICRRAQLASNAGWIKLRALAASGRGHEEAQRALDEALSLTREGCAAGLGNVLVNMALLKLEMGRANEARAHLEEARRAGGWAEVGGWTQMLEARIVLAEGKADRALAAFDVLRKEGERLLLPELVYEGAVGRAEAFAALEKRTEAREAFVEAANALTAWSKGAPVGEGRGTFLSARQRGARAAVDFWLREVERGDEHAAREAMDAARHSLVGFVRAFQWVDRVEALSVERRKRWDEAVAAYRHERVVLEEKAAARGPGAGALEAERAALRSALDRALAELGPNDDFSPPKPLSIPGTDEALFVVHPVLNGLAGFVMTNGGRSVVARRLSPVSPDATPAMIADMWLAPFRATLQQVRRVRLILPADASKMDWHVLPFDGAPLFERAEVVYSLDLGSRPEQSGAKALVIADPTEDLPGARASTAAVISALESRGMQVESLVGQAATHEAVRDALESPAIRFLHYAGHATFDGPDGLEASLRLAQRGRFSVADIMALAHVPQVVILAGCETARAAAGQGLGLAQAFLLKGARAALASPRPLGDAFAQEATRLLYTQPIERDPFAAYRATLRALRLAAPEGEWASLRLLVE